MRCKRSLMGKRNWRGLVAVSIFTLLTACGWFGGGSGPVGKARPGADRQIAPTGELPSANPGRRSEQTVVPADETRGTTPAIGSVVTTKGGQRAQKEATDKAAAERDTRAREQRGAADRSVKGQQTVPLPSVPSE